MRTLLAILASMIVATSTSAQKTHLPVPVSPFTPYTYYGPWQPFWLASPFAFNPTFITIDNSNRHWQLKPYASVSAGMIFLNGGGASYLSAPAGLMLARPLNNNLAAFSRLSIAPTVLSMNPLVNPMQTSNQYNLGLSTRLEGGLMYTNDARTFSISGSISVERDSYPIYSPAGQPRIYQAR